ncbi:proteasome assembly chaperone 1-like [Cloeon dipterum]|uniref:proteasome assembly chaperone 1-like n=1 Tax=Cloeon dipterum TaxID=197152 RepID=UPI0032203C9E
MAASFFGEIVEPASRAFFDFGEDDFDEESSAEKCEFKITWKTEALRYDTVLVFHGKISNAFADRSFFDQGLCCGTVEKVTKQSLKKDAATFYSLQNDILALSVTAVEDIHSVPFIDCLDEIISKTKRVVVICSLPAARYLGEQRIEDGLLRCLVTSAKIEDLKIRCTTLEQPNFVPGVPAAFMSYCCLKQKPGYLLLCYSDDDPDVVDSRTLLPFNPIMTCPLFKSICKREHSSKLTGSAYGNIYM